ncbi:hypothetical protein HT585_23015 [Ensifer sp. HO-A22]|uniref:Uncharacterized protein n=1 Tax=Ensifer oleiphilus TaxID=2742698 RepID=A0A7Y6UPU5_9HYPH|nr:hypothetical protein [Ensifer oleiphilus]NVD41745.1 hypothetical protein [Ensifer oleiphilus]
MDDPVLRNALREALLQLETDGHIVIVSTTLGSMVHAVANKIADVVPHTELSFRELYATRQLINQAIHDNRFFDREMPTLTGLTAEEFRIVADKLLRE